MTIEQHFVSYSTISEKALRELEKLIKKKPQKKPKPVKVVMYNDVKSLKELAEEGCLRYKIEYDISKDERLAPFKGFKLSPRKRNEKGPKEPHLGLKEVLQRDKEPVEIKDHTPIDWEITDLVCNNGLIFLKPTKLNGDCFFSAVIEISIFYDDLDIPSDTVALRKWLMKRIMKLPIIPEWVTEYFGGDRARFISHMVGHFNTGTETDDFGLVVKGTAMVLGRRFRIITEAHAKPGGFHEINATPETAKRPIYWLGLEKNHYRALARPGQKNSEEEKRKRNGVKMSKPEADEKRRRKEKEKSADETDKEALEKTMEAMQRKCAIAENELTLALRREKTQSAFIMHLEKRIANACEKCREEDPELLMTSRDNYNLTEIKEMLLKQEKNIEALMAGRLIAGEEKKEDPEGKL